MSNPEARLIQDLEILSDQLKEKEIQITIMAAVMKSQFQTNAVLLKAVDRAVETITQRTSSCPEQEGCELSKKVQGFWPNFGCSFKEQRACWRTYLLDGE